MTAMLDKEVAVLRRANAELRGRVDELQRRVDQAFAERDESLQRETATTEVLQVINSSPGNLAPVFDAILEKAHSLCGADYGSLLTYDGESFRPVARHGPSAHPAFSIPEGVRPATTNLFGRIVRGEGVVHIQDMAELARDSDDPMTRTLVEIGGIRTQLMVPLRKDNLLLGVITANRQQVRPFSDKQIALLQNFAAQAVIAMENARLINETREALEQQTATAEVLGVINSSPDDLTPVFDAILEKAHTLCGADHGAMFLCDAENFRAIATRGTPESFAEHLRQGFHANDTPLSGRLLAGEPFVQIRASAQTENLIHRPMDAIASNRTLLSVPLHKSDKLFGMIVAGRFEVQPFTDKQIALLQNFAAQAVIAMENARLITETREALDQQTATAEVLGVINSSPGDLKPVFDAMLEKATRLCGAPRGQLAIYDGGFFRFVAVHGEPGYTEDLFGRGPMRPEIGVTWSRIARGEHIVHMVDVMDSELYRDGHEGARSFVDVGGGRSLLTVALRKDESLLGALTIYRQEVRPFSEKQIALLQNFAAQAVIAMENARLLTETREALEQQTATAEVLQVINSAPGDLKPVFDTMLGKATRLCEAKYGLLATYDGDRFHGVAAVGFPIEIAEGLSRLGHPPPATVLGRLERTKETVQMEDISAEPSYAEVFAVNPILRGVRTSLSVPMLKEGELVGAFNVFRQEVRPFTDKQIALLQNFAAQAVIAIENARLLTETREALEQQTGTAEVLQVINSSPGDLAPVFQSILEKAHSLCDAAYGGLLIREGEELRVVAAHGEARFVEAWRALGGVRPPQGSLMARLMAGDRLIHVPDAQVHDGYHNRPAELQRLFEIGNVRTLLIVPLRKDGALLGTISAFRQEVRPFTDKQISLLENFAAQAVIAMENARLLTETREALEKQTATAEILRVISGSPSDLQPTFDAIAANATILSGAAAGMVYRFDGALIHFVANYELPPDVLQAAQRYFPSPPGRQSTTHRAIQTREVVHIADVATDPEYAQPAIVQSGWHTALAVPILQDGNPVGAITVVRREVAPFSQAQIELLKTFADQAVIAIENVRLFNELNERTRDLEESLEYQTATSDVLNVISRSTADVQPVLDTVAETAARLCSADDAAITIREGGVYRYVSAYAADPEFWANIRQRAIVPGRETIAGRVALEGRVVHVADLAADPDYAVPEAVATGNRTVLGVPLLREGAVLGTIGLARNRVQPFTERQIELVRTFADQAVIAMENARLLGEIRQRQQELRVTFDNMVDGVAMLDDTLHLAAWNRNFQELLQLPDEFLSQRPDFDAYIRYLTERGEFGETDPETQITQLRARIGDHYSFERTRPDGTVIEVRNNPMPDGGIVVIYSDITERKRSEAEIRAARDAAEAAYRDLKAAQASLIQAEKMASLGQLTAGIAHEIKNPLNFVNNFADLSVELLDELKETAAPAIAVLDEEKRTEIDETIGMLTGNLEKIAEHGRRADGIVKSMLEHSRGTSGERRSVDLNGLIDEALNLAYHGGRAQDASFNITLERDFADTIAPIELVPQDITRVCLNLFGNGFYAATKRQKEGSDPNFKPTLKVSTRDLGDTVEVQVRDNGVGIAPEIKDKLFQPFFTTKPTGEGTGLGLSISYDIVTQQHSGTITVDSRVGDFTEFTVRLPRTHQTTMAEAAS
jgi:GAF domain-containing protein